MDDPIFDAVEDHLPGGGGVGPNNPAAQLVDGAALVVNQIVVREQVLADVKEMSKRELPGSPWRPARPRSW